MAPPLTSSSFNGRSKRTAVDGVTNRTIAHRATLENCLNPTSQYGPGGLTKFVAVERSSRVPALYWWTLPLPLRVLAAVNAEALAATRAVVYPGAAIGAATAEVGAETGPNGTALVANVQALFEASDAGRIGPCTIAVFPAAFRGPGLEALAARLPSDLETLPFAIALRADGDGRARHHFCFRVPGKVIAALEHLALGRSFGGNPAAVEMALLQGLRLRAKQRSRLRLVMHAGEAALVGQDSSGRNRITYLETGKGYTGIYEPVRLADALGDRAREAWRRFPIGVALFIGLPFFIATFWIATLMGRSGAQATSAPRLPAAPEGSAAGGAQTP